MNRDGSTLSFGGVFSSGSVPFLNHITAALRLAFEAIFPVLVSMTVCSSESCSHSGGANSGCGRPSSARCMYSSQMGSAARPPVS